MASIVLGPPRRILRRAGQRARDYDGPFFPRPDAVTLLTGYALLLVCIPSQLIFSPLGGAGTPALLTGGLLLVLWAGARVAGAVPPEIRTQPVRMVVYALLTSVFLSYVAAASQARAGVEVRGADRGVVTMVALSGVAVVAADGIVSMDRMNVFLRRLVALGAFLAFLGMLQFWFAVDVTKYIQIPGLVANADLANIQQRSIFRRVAGTASHPIEYGVMLAMLYPLAVHYATVRMDKRWRGYVWLTLITAAIPMCLSRSAMLGLVTASLVLFAGWTWPERRRAVKVALIFLVVMRFAIPGLLGTIRSLFMNLGTDPSIQGRTDDYALVGIYIRQSPWIGRGFGTFNPTLYTTLDNQYLLQLIEMGAVGFLALLTVFAVGIGCSRGVRGRAPDGATRSLGQAMVASITVPLTTFATFDGLSFPMVAGITFLLLGCAGAMWRLLGGFSTPYRHKVKDAARPRAVPEPEPAAVTA